MNVSDPETRNDPESTGASQAGPFGDHPDPGPGHPNQERQGQERQGQESQGKSQGSQGQETGRRDTSSRQGGSQQERGGQQGGGQKSSGLPNPDRLLDELIPEQVEWETLVRRYPKPALLAAAGLGFYVALQRGPALVAALSGFAAQEMTRRVNDFLGTDVL